MDIKQSDLGLLVALDALLAESNVTRAADRMNISQPAMSAQLARLRDLFDDPLLIPSGRKMMPTARALALQEPLHQRLLELSKLIKERQPFDPATTSRIFRIIAPDYLQMVVTPQLVRDVSAIAPNIQIVTLPFDRSTAWPLLENLKADMLIIWRQLTPQDAKATQLFKDRLCFVQRKKHPRGMKKPKIDDLCQLPHAMIAPDPGSLWGVVDEELKKHGRRRRIVASLPSFLSVPALVAQSDVVAAIPRRLAKAAGDQLDIFDLPFPGMEYQMLLAWHPRMHADIGHQWLRKLIAVSVAKQKM